jgi:hypothetical protein
MWTPDLPLKELPEAVRKCYVHEADYLYHELLHNRLVVCLIDAHPCNFQGHKIRAAESWNPDWYSEMYQSHPHFRRDRSLRALSSLAKGADRRFYTYRHGYERLYREFIHSRLTEGYTVDGEDIPPVDEVRRYFEQGLEERVKSI